MPRTPSVVSYWQVGSGQGARDYSQECLDYGLAFVGERYEDEIRKIEDGDVVVLRDGTRKIVAVGRAISHGGEVTGLDVLGLLLPENSR